MTRHRGRTVPLTGDPDYRQIWRIVYGALRQAFHDHPDYIAPRKRKDFVRRSLTKRIAGALKSHRDQRCAAQAAQVRSGSSPAHDTASGAILSAGTGEQSVAAHPPRTPALRTGVRPGGDRPLRPVHEAQAGNAETAA